MSLKGPAVNTAILKSYIIKSGINISIIIRSVIPLIKTDRPDYARKPADLLTRHLQRFNDIDLLKRAFSCAAFRFFVLRPGFSDELPP